MTEGNNKVESHKGFEEKQESSSGSDVDVVTILRDLKDKVDLLQKDQASLRSDIVEHVVRVLAGRWKEEQARRRERRW